MGTSDEEIEEDLNEFNFSIMGIPCQILKTLLLENMI